jgi:hypothetical protein
MGRPQGDTGRKSIESIGRDLFPPRENLIRPIANTVWRIQKDPQNIVRAVQGRRAFYRAQASRLHKVNIQTCIAFL